MKLKVVVIVTVGEIVDVVDIIEVIAAGVLVVVDITVTRSDQHGRLKEGRCR